MTEIEIENLLSKNTDELYMLLGEDGASGVIGFDPIKKGKEMYQNIIIAIQLTLCDDKRIREMFDKPQTYNRVILVSSIADLIAQFGLPISPFTVAVLCVKEGLDTVCKTIWDE